MKEEGRSHRDAEDELFLPSDCRPSPICPATRQTVQNTWQVDHVTQHKLRFHYRFRLNKSEFETLRGFFYITV